MTLIEFLESASTDHSVALTEARAHTEYKGRMVSSDVMTMLLVKHGLYGHFSDVAQDKAHNARDLVLAFMDRVRTNSVFNFQSGHPKGSQNLGMVDTLINSLMTDKAEELQALKADVVAESVDTVKPFESVTLHNVLIARNACPVKPVSNAGGWVKITVASDVENHNPRLLASNPRTGEMVRVNSFYGVAYAGAYDCRVPPEWSNADLFVDDAYGVI